MGQAIFKAFAIKAVVMNYTPHQDTSALGKCYPNFGLLEVM